jgi:hypothetical protein
MTDGQELDLNGRTYELADALLEDDADEQRRQRNLDWKILRARLLIETTPQETEDARRRGYWMGGRR